ncbi:hypothetical protein SCOCK_180075 [Actinacidiphila cocklensis]|uniref:Uncharacterized protein n=1 Tax=Actinacidiphila cocklensis TaxID=887465 RepID=A0A9W4GPT0_9ACTN|nr:hypothetical protein SCOCK_180075 [Actinacidiphila cocklensis]
MRSDGGRGPRPLPGGLAVCTIESETCSRLARPVTLRLYR